MIQNLIEIKSSNNLEWIRHTYLFWSSSQAFVCAGAWVQRQRLSKLTYICIIWNNDYDRGNNLCLHNIIYVRDCVENLVVMKVL